MLLLPEIVQDWKSSKHLLWITMRLLQTFVESRSREEVKEPHL